MFRTLTVSLLAGTLALTAPAAEASDRRMSQQDKTAAAVFGLLTLGLIAHAANKEEERKKDRRKAERRKAERERALTAERERLRREEEARVARVPIIRNDGYSTGGGRHGLSVPASCARRVQTESGRERTAFGAPCLRRAGVNVARLPQRCERRLDIGRGEISAWGARCLDREGVRIR